MIQQKADKRIHIILVTLQLLFVANGQQICYWPSKLPVHLPDRYLPCQDGNTTCCAQGDACLSNGLCWSGNINSAYRGACTSPDGYGCPNQYCNDVDANGLSHIVKCLKGALGSQMFFYTCGRSDARCQINNMRARVVEWIPASVKAVLPPFTSSKNKLTLTSTRTVTEKASGVSTRSSRNSTEDSSSKSVSAQSSSTINGSSNNTPPVITSIVYRNQTIANNSDSKPMMTVGASLGIPLGLACFGFVGYLFWKRGHGQRSIPQLSDQQKARRILTPTIPESTSNELAGHFEGFELVAPHPIHEI